MGTRRFSPKQIRNIRSRYKTYDERKEKWVTLHDLAKLHSVTIATISNIVNRQIYADVE